MPEPVRILFVCTENSCRSQMAEAFVRMAGLPDVEALSAGSSPSGKVNPRAIELMAELGYDLSTHESKGVAELSHKRFDYVISMGCGDQCPFVPGTVRADWGLPDPKRMPPDEFRAVRDSIGAKVQELLRNIETSRNDTAAG